MSNNNRWAMKTIMAVGLAGSLMTAAVLPAQAGDGGAIAAGIIGGTALGVLAGAAIAGAPHPPPPPVYYAPDPAYYAPPPHCWYEHHRVWDYDGDAYVVRPVRVCNY